ncbi:M23 family metallopeptidase [Acetonema longum]|uniref:Peptidase M23 n=1 Tax=Acetonema longum DSM 6540 TaxID=1009370 RepID=F7NGD5_9FIRM|nr:M23 family metallopeptidase [Acetonema longum]EGO64890.1 Peptidase M23 [Acetonema longum DSM 6540]
MSKYPKIIYILATLLEISGLSIADTISWHQIGNETPQSFAAVASAKRRPLKLVTGRLELQQGDILSLRLLNVPKGIQPEAKTDLGMSVFVPVGDQEWFAAIPVSNTREPGRYTVHIQAGKTAFATEVTVLAFNFDRQNLIINTKSQAIREATSDASYQEFNAKFLPVYNLFDRTRYWSGTFTHPVKGRISTNFGEIRITNGDPASKRTHRGMDFAVDTGTPVLAPNAGRVVFAQRLLLTGYTVVIEHGGGLKSIYYHMNSITVSVDQIVQQGTQIGTVGSTGYSTGPHLHYEMRIGNQAVSPSLLFAPEAGLYSAEANDTTL